MQQAKDSLRSSSPLSRKRNRFRTRSLETAAIAIAAAGAAERADAAIIWDGAVNASTGSTFSIDGTVLGEVQVRSGMMGADLFLFANNAMGMGSTVELSVFDSGTMPAFDFLHAYTNETVDGTLTTWGTRAYIDRGATANPEWIPGDLAYAGFRFDTGGGTLYGWLQIQFNGTGSDFTVLQSAYDDTGAGIVVGAIPEPGTAFLLGLGLVGLGAVARKRARATASEAAS